MTRTRDDFDLRKLEVFYWVAELKSFSQAAAHLALTQPTVSAHISELEEKLGSKILSRVGGKVGPTAVGQVLFERAKSLLALKRETLAALPGPVRHEKARGPLGLKVLGRQLAHLPGTDQENDPAVEAAEDLSGQRQRCATILVCLL